MTVDVISFNDSEHSRQREENRRILSKRQPHINEMELIDLSKVKSYYKSELAKMFTTGNEVARNHLFNSWKIINTFRNLYQSNNLGNPQSNVKMITL